MISKYKNIIIVIVILIIGFVIYSLTRPDPDISSSLVVSTPQNSEQILGQTIIRALGQVSSLSLDKSILTDPVVQSLRDKSTAITPVDNPGRQNPFAPFSSASRNATSTETITIETRVNNN